MYNHRIDISLGYWMLIYLFGMIIGAGLGLLFWQVGAGTLIANLFLGLVGGALITILASVVTSFVNNRYLIGKAYYIAYTVGFGHSFLAGFLGIYLILWVSSLIGVDTRFIQDPFVFALIGGFLSYAFGIMLYWLTRHKSKKELLERDIMETKLWMLESQLNPHFLFNALNVISEVLYSNPTKAEQAIIKLSAILRSAINHESLISLEKELELCVEYVWLSQLSLEHIILDIAPYDLSLRHHTIPKFSIQLLVENSIKHGLIKNQMLHIKITIILHGSLLVIEVSDDGKGFEVLKKGVGLTNLEKRLSMLNGGRLDYLHSDNKSIFRIEVDTQ